MTLPRYNPNYFLSTTPNIDDNEELREPQIEAYQAARKHFLIDKSREDAVIILPTGVGKTGLMGILPYGISEGRVLIITPQLTIKDTVIDSLDPENPGNFWIKRKVLESRPLPCLIEYDSSVPKWVLTSASIVVLNIHKLQGRLESSLLNQVESDFFDMIIIDEAHHSTAETWKNAIKYFNKAKIIKVTGTPFRSDGQKIVGKEIYEYLLSRAMANGYIKSLDNITYVPDELHLTIDGDDKLYTVEQVFELLKRDEDWISRSVAYSEECSRKVAWESVKLLKKKKKNSPVPHKIIAVAISIRHAEQIKAIYQEYGLSTAVIHSEVEGEIQSIHKDIETNRVQVVINVMMLSEGYDHPYLSIAAIFRPFRTLLPYVQFVGRVLRAIPEGEAVKVEDNIAEIVSHKNLYLDELWEYFKIASERSNTIKFLKKQKDIEENDEEPLEKGEREAYRQDYGGAEESGAGSVTQDTLIRTELIQKRNKEFKDKQKKIKDVQDLLNLSKEDAERIIDETNTKESKGSLRPDQHFKKVRKDVNIRIREEIVPDLIQRFSIDREGVDLAKCMLLFGQRTKHSWIPRRKSNNAGMLAMLFNDMLKRKIGRKRDDWGPNDFEIADRYTDDILALVEKNLKEFYNLR